VYLVHHCDKLPAKDGIDEEERRKDAHDWEAIVANLRQGDSGYRHYLKVERQPLSFANCSRSAWMDLGSREM
jgi:hypothetical protein